MARPRESDEAVALDAAIQCFWSRGYEATSVHYNLNATNPSTIDSKLTLLSPPSCQTAGQACRPSVVRCH